ncbi:hypothetical protein [Enterovibrio norvegicus]|uniref:hypothetical protein n=1 Tax=Enterovibrio norvegicus TaxID=188144 RepID=UPI00352FEB01
MKKTLLALVEQLRLIEKKFGTCPVSHEYSSTDHEEEIFVCDLTIYSVWEHDDYTGDNTTNLLTQLNAKLDKGLGHETFTASLIDGWTWSVFAETPNGKETLLTNDDMYEFFHFRTALLSLDSSEAMLAAILSSNFYAAAECTKADKDADFWASNNAKIPSIQTEHGPCPHLFATKESAMTAISNSGNQSLTLVAVRWGISERTATVLLDRRPFVTADIFSMSSIDW